VLVISAYARSLPAPRAAHRAVPVARVTFVAESS
jgi:hypothetical protein